MLLPGFPSDELEQVLRGLGFERFVHTRHGQPLQLPGGLTITIHIQTSISDGPGGDSALMVDDGEVRLLDMNDCRIHDLAPLTADRPVDIQWLQYSGAIWYPMVYDHPPAVMRTTGRPEGGGAAGQGAALRRGRRRPGRSYRRPARRASSIPSCSAST